MTVMKMKEKVVLEQLGSMEESEREGIRDIRGFSVINSEGSEIGTVDEIFVDPRHRHMPMVSIKIGGMLGIGAHTILVPLDQIVILENAQVRVKTKDEVESETYTGAAI